MKQQHLILPLIFGALTLGSQAFTQPIQDAAQGQAIVTVLPAHGSAEAAPVAIKDLQLKINGKPAAATAWTALRGADAPIEMVVLIDSGIRTDFGSQLSELADFVKEAPSHARIAIAVMQNGQAILATPLSDNPTVALRGVRLPLGSAGSSASPYFCLSDLAKHWPSTDQSARRVVVMITNGIDNYLPRFDPDDLYVQAAIQDSVRARLLVYSIYWQDRGGPSSTSFMANGGLSLLQMVADATGGKCYSLGTGEPVSLIPYLTDLRVQLRNQYRLSFSAPLEGKSRLLSLHVKASTPGVKTLAPEQVMVTQPAGF
jgi:hypothetical protein